MESVVVDQVTKTFSLRHNKSLKEAVASRFRKEPSVDRFTALDDVSFTISAGEIVGLIGANGSGKSTLLRLVSGVMTPDAGMVRIRGSVAGLIAAGAGFVPDLTGRANVYLNGAILGMSRGEIDAKFDPIVEFAEVEQFIDTPVKYYSSGMYSRLSFAVAAFSEPDVFLVDEVMAVGDQFFKKKSQEKFDEIRASGRTMVIVSHNLADVRRLCDRGIYLKRGRVVADGPIDQVVNEFQSSPGR
jgi:ABC-2 type transport system ATP-binding protein